MSVFTRSALGLGLFLAMMAPAHAGTPLPDSFATPGLKVVAHVQAIGDQIYECKADASGAKAWQFREPLATLTEDGKTVGRHFAGPRWLFDDGSFVAGKVSAKADGATAQDIPWLKLDVVAQGGQGRLTGVTTVERVATQGGVFTGPCTTAGDLHLEPYRADYVFLGH
jgi:hypothetical protein